MTTMKRLKLLLEAAWIMATFTSCHDQSGSTIHIVAMKELTNHLAEADEFIRDFVLGDATDAVRTDWKLATPEDMATPEHMARFVPYYI